MTKTSQERTLVVISLFSLSNLSPLFSQLDFKVKP